MHHFPGNIVGQRLRRAYFKKAVNHAASQSGRQSRLHLNFDGRPMARRPSVAFADYDIADSRTSYMSSSLLIFAIMEGVTSFVLPIIDVFGPPKHVEHRFYFEIFQIIQFTISILALAYLQALIAYYTGKQIGRDCETIEEEFENEGSQEPWEVPRIVVFPPSTDDVSAVCESDALTRLPWNPTELSGDETEETKEASDVNSGPQSDEEHYKCQSRTEPFTNHLALHHYEHERLCAPDTETSVPLAELRSLKASEAVSSPPVHNTLLVNGMKLTGANACKTGRNGLEGEFDEEEEEKAEQQKDKLQVLERQTVTKDRRIVKKQRFHTPKIFRRKCRKFRGQTRALKWGKEGINLYLRLGAVVFGFGVMILDGFSVSDQFQEDNYINSCHSVLWIPKNVIHSIYIFLQTYFLFKYHRVVFNVQKFFLRFILCHMAVVNLGQWLNTVVQEVMTSSKPPSEEHRVPLTVLEPFRDVINYQHSKNISQMQFDVHSGNTSGIVPVEKEGDKVSFASQRPRTLSHTLWRGVQPDRMCYLLQVVSTHWPRQRRGK
uniref:Otopetrin n=1 Tax=Schistocephalus solidus TaxID=70667 RepID=A0A0X3P253_SCHSO